ncbi:MAG: hypothetical protein ACI85O_001021 [Saprospiraceae bacterium]|jgi:hypothetical protein
MKKSSKKSIKDFKNTKKQILSNTQKSKIKGGVGSEDILIV